MRTKESVAELARPITAANARYNIERGARAGSGEHLRVCQRSRRRRQEGGDGSEEEHCTAARSRISDEVDELLAVGGLLLLAAVAAFLAPILGV